jgi:hypothetical protein
VEEIEEARNDFSIAGRTEPDGPGKAFRQRHAFVGDTRGKVEHVARLEHPLRLVLEAREDLEGQPGNEGLVPLARDAPAALSAPLQEEDVVAVHVGADAAARRRVAHHDVVDAGVGDEIEAREQARGRRGKKVRILDQDGPIAAWKLLQARGRQGPVLDGPRCTAAAHEARGDIVASGESPHFTRRERVLEAGKRAAHEQRFALPMHPHEMCDIDGRRLLARVQNGLESIRLSSVRGCQCYT